MIGLGVIGGLLYVAACGYLAVAAAIDAPERLVPRRRPQCPAWLADRAWRYLYQPRHVRGIR